MTGTEGAGGDRLASLAAWPAVAVAYGIALPGCFGLAEFTIDWLGAALLLEVAAAVLGMVWIDAVVRHLRLGRTRRAAAALIAPALGYAVAAVWSPTQPGLQLRLLADQPWLQYYIARLPEPPGHRHLYDDWGDAGSAIEGPLRIYTLIYDEDGTVANLDHLRATHGQDGPITLRPIRGDFYLMAQFP